MKPLRFILGLAVLGSALGGCIENQFLWTLTSEEGTALRAASSVTAAPESPSAGWRLVCQRDVLPETRACSLQAGLALGSARTVAVWPREDFAALYGRDTDPGRLTSGDGSALTPSRCLGRSGGGSVCVYAGGAGRQVLADLRAGHPPQLEAGGRSAALPEGFGPAERDYARESRGWVERNRMEGGGGGGAGGSM